MKLTVVSKVISFQQKKYMKEYVDFNIKMKMQRKSDYKKNFYKLINNTS